MAEGTGASLREAKSASESLRRAPVPCRQEHLPLQEDPLQRTDQEHLPVEDAVCAGQLVSGQGEIMSVTSVRGQKTPVKASKET